MKITGKILFGINNIYTVESENRIYQCRIKGKILKDQEKLYNPLTAGDIVDVETDSHSDSQGVISALHKRKSVFTRWNRKRMALQLIASNIDILFCITTPDDPPFRPRFIDRMLISGEGKYERIVLLNKSDLHTDRGTVERLDDYERIGIKVMKCSAMNNSGIDEIREIIKDKFCVFAGQSGVGKSTLINTLAGENLQKTGEISHKYCRGRHTTNYSILLPYGNGGIIDTPGIRDIFIQKVEPEKLSDLFVEFRPFSRLCAFSGCSHIAENNCAVKKGVEEGKIHNDRYTSYLRLFSEMTEKTEEIYGSAYT